MAFLPPLGSVNPQLSDALKKLSAAKFGKSRAEVEKEIFTRLRAGDEAKDAKKRELEQRMKSIESGQSASRPGAVSSQSATGSSFLDEWLAKRKQQSNVPAAPGSQQGGKQASGGSELVAPSETPPAAPADATEPEIPSNAESQSPLVGIPTTDKSMTQKDNRLDAMQQTGIGDSVELKTTAVQHPVEATHNDRAQLEEQIQKTAEQTSVLVDQEKTDTLRISKLPKQEVEEEDPAAGIEEISIDIRGRLSRIQEAEASKAKAKAEQDQLRSQAGPS